MANIGSATSGIADQFQRHFSKELLDYIVKSLQMVQFAKRAPLPEKSGSKTIRWFRFDEPSTTNVKTLVEGDAIGSSDYRTMSLSSIDADLVQYGEVLAITDVLKLSELFNHLEQGVKITGQDAALHFDTLLRNKLGSDITGKQTRMAQGLANYAAVNSATAADAKVVSNDLLDAATALRNQSTPTIGGTYAMVCAPAIARDLMTTDAWLNASQYSAVEQLWKGEIGSLFGVRVIQTTSGFTSDGSTQHTFASGDVHSSFITGSDAFGVSDVNSQSPYAPKVYVTQGASKDDPIDQVTKVGWKTFHAEAVLQPKYYVELYSKTAFA